MKTSSVTIQEEDEDKQVQKQSIPLQETRRRSTRATNKLRLNAKSVFDPSLKGKQPIEIEYEPE